MPSAPSTIIPLPLSLECMAETAISYVSLGFPPPQLHNTANIKTEADGAQCDPYYTYLAPLAFHRPYRLDNVA